MIGLHMLHGPPQGTTQHGAFISSSSSPSQHPRDGSSGGISRLNQPNIVRIPAKTALPIVSSVPKCRSSKASRHHPIETVNGSSVSHSTTSNGRISHINQADQVLLIVNDDHIKGGGVPIIGRRLPSKSMAMRSAAAAYTTPDASIRNNNQIHNEPEMAQIDYSMLPQTIELDTKAPVVGRRSHRLIQQQQQQQQQQLQRAATVYQQAMFDEQIIRQQDSTKKTNKKSNKQQPFSVVETRLATSQQVHHLLARSMPFDDYHHQQLTTNHSSSNKSAATNRHTKNLHPVKYQSISIMNIAEPIAEYSLPPMQQVGGRAQRNYFDESPNISGFYDQPKVSGRGGQVAKQAGVVTRGGVKGVNLTLGTVPSSSCSSLCSTTAAAAAKASLIQLNNSTGCANKLANYPRCCSPATVCSSSSEQIVDESYICEQACCQPIVEGGVCEQNNRCSETTSCNDPSCNILARVQSCCMAIQQPVRPQKSACSNKQPKQPMVGKVCTKLYNQQQQQLHHHHHHHHHHHDNNHGSLGRRARTTNNHQHSHHHHSCLANGSSVREVSSKPSASCRSSSLHDSRRQLNNSTSQQQFNHQPMLISGRNILPVHPKPNLSHSPLLLSQQQQCCDNLAATASASAAAAAQQTRKNRGGLNIEDNTNVNQMYESLAAELKAKLGDPKMGPILLPPKDYDTMSRKQGRLTGIELRRSTNPQLVGPAASRLNSSSLIAFHHNDHEDSINEERIVVNSSVVNNRNSEITSTTTGSPIGSDRSSGRSQDDRSLQRSRSNSSSGLGSISMGPSSPSSPPISSNEDMRQTTTTQQSCSSGKNFSTKLDRDSNDNDDDRRRLRRHHHHNLTPIHDRKDSSPDNCNSSDSGHSGSGRLDSAMSSEERKVLLRDKNHSLLTTTTTSNNNNNNNDSNMPTRNISDKTGNDRMSGPRPYKTKQIAVGRNQVGDEAVGSARNSSSSSLSKDETRTRDKVAHDHLNSTKISSSPSLWNGRVEVPLKVNSGKNGNTYLATKQIIY